LQTPYECEAQGSHECRAAVHDFYGVAIANYYVSQNKWPGDYAVDAVNQTVGPDQALAAPQYGPGDTAAPGFTCVPSLMRDCLQLSSNSACVASGCQWVLQCLPDPCTLTGDPCCGKHGKLCGDTEILAEVHASAPRRCPTVLKGRSSG
jgi:hypothetical protein